MHIRRRQFLQQGTMAAAGTMLIPQFLQALGQPQVAAVPPGTKVLVVLQLSGGNDGLNTIIPVRNDIYYRSRPRIGIAKDKALALTDEVGIHPALTHFKQCYDQGEMAILNSVGYPNPDRSHFRSMDIWHSASPSNQYWNTGWLGRYLDAACNGTCAHATQALEIDDVLSLALKGDQQKGMAVQDPARLYSSSQNKLYRSLLATKAQQEEPTANYLYKTLGNAINNADYIFKASKASTSTATYPSTELGKSLKTIASLVFSDINTKVYYVSLGSFDTHTNQDNQQNRLFTELNGAVGAFVSDLKAQGRFDDVLLCTFSEFGRRVAQNGSGGTDHGTANNMFFVGGGLKRKGLLNDMPNLSTLENGDLIHQVDFKNVYATLLNQWLKADANAILGTPTQALDFI
ncbi:MAG: DUF1501 domain-containing protein [Bacteroidetes bacterium]|nr:MAG: DUF1501 domain-containing protein [Bacteroidota bacterium]